jgi:hypothetical protein
MPDVPVGDISTKEDLERWREERARQRQRGGEPTPPIDPRNYDQGSWQGDVNVLVAILKGLKVLMKLLIDRIPEQPAARFNAVFDDVEQHINWAISDLYDIANVPEPTTHPCYRALQARGLTGAQLELKAAETDARINDSPPDGVLEQFEVVVKSLIDVIFVLKPVEEFKETLVNRIKHGGDRHIQTLDIFRDQQPWHRYK